MPEKPPQGKLACGFATTLTGIRLANQTLLRALLVVLEGFSLPLGCADTV